jgi:hypothetical protein
MIVDDDDIARIEVLLEAKEQARRNRRGSRGEQARRGRGATEKRGRREK